MNLIKDDDDNVLCNFCFDKTAQFNAFIYKCYACHLEIYSDHPPNIKWIRLECAMDNNDQYAMSLDFNNQQTGIHYYPDLTNLTPVQRMAHVSGKINPSILWIKHLVKDVNPWNVKEKIKFLLTYS